MGEAYISCCGPTERAGGVGTTVAQSPANATPSLWAPIPTPGWQKLALGAAIGLALVPVLVGPLRRQHGGDNTDALLRGGRG